MPDVTGPHRAAATPLPPIHNAGSYLDGSGAPPDVRRSLRLVRERGARAPQPHGPYHARTDQTAAGDLAMSSAAIFPELSTPGSPAPGCVPAPAK